MKRYTLGFAFDNVGNVLLVEKSKPDWQKGLLNGVGGKLEDFDNSIWEGMSREFFEEVGIENDPIDWTHLFDMQGYDWCVHVFRCTESIDLSGLDYKLTDTDEVLRVLPVQRLFNSLCISNVPWLVGMCLDKDIYNSTEYFIYREPHRPHDKNTKYN